MFFKQNFYIQKKSCYSNSCCNGLHAQSPVALCYMLQCRQHMMILITMTKDVCVESVW